MNHPVRSVPLGPNGWCFFAFLMCCHHSPVPPSTSLVRFAPASLCPTLLRVSSLAGPIAFSQSSQILLGMGISLGFFTYSRPSLSGPPSCHKMLSPGWSRAAGLAPTAQPAQLTTANTPRNSLSCAAKHVPRSKCHVFFSL